MLWGVSLFWFALATWWVVVQREQILAHALELPPWIILLIILNLLPVHGSHATLFTPDVPAVAAAGIVLSPIEAGLVCFIGTFDSREVRGGISLTKAIFNRSQIALANFTGSLVVHELADAPAESGLLIPLALVMLGTSVAVNGALVSVAVSLERRVAIADVLRRLRLGAFSDYVLALLAWGVLGGMLAALYSEIHPWALLAFLAPILLGRQVLARSQMFIDTKKAYQSREEAIRELTRQMHKERLDERRLIAADLHDEVLQPLFKVTLMAHVLKADLASGRLLEIEEDLPKLMTAADLASGSLRELIGDLRRSSLGPRGLEDALAILCHTSRQDDVAIHNRIAKVSTSPVEEVSLYQIAKEALSNALVHSKAKNIYLELGEGDGVVQLAIRDDGIGFDPIVAKERHFGLQIMQERAAAIGASLYIDTAPGAGCEVRLHLPSGS